jgi:CNT family concentrative nucleoside transporter
MEQAQAVFGVLVMCGLCWAASTARRAIRWRPVLWGLGLQLVIAFAVIVPDCGEGAFKAIDVAVGELVSYSEAGSAFVFQTVERHAITTFDAAGQPTTTTIVGTISPPLKTIAFWVLPTVMFFSALMALLYHYGVMQRIVRAVAFVMQRTLGTSGPESLSAAANIFVGQTEAPLVVRPWVATMTRSELHAVMVGGFATVAGGVMAIYVAVVPVEGIAGHLVTASLMSAPAALAISKLLVPETEAPADVATGDAAAAMASTDANGIDAITRGTLEGLQLFLNILAMLLVFVAMVTLVNALLGALGDVFGVALSMQGLLGWVCAPFAWLMGVPWHEAGRVGALLGEKMVLTELVAFIDLGTMQKGAEPLSERTALITSYALCGFANFASIGIQIGGIAGLAPERRGDLARLGFRAMIGGTLAAMMTGAIAGLFL